MVEVGYISPFLHNHVGLVDVLVDVLVLVISDLRVYFVTRCIVRLGDGIVGVIWIERLVRARKCL
jgi:hypothetical protein